MNSYVSNEMIIRVLKLRLINDRKIIKFNSYDVYLFILVQYAASVMHVRFTKVFGHIHREVLCGRHCSLHKTNLITENRIHSLR